MNDDFVLTKPIGITDSSWEALCDALELYAAEWDDYDNDEDDEGEDNE
jgi:hypothetical protein